MKKLLMILLLLAATKSAFAQGQPLYFVDTNKPNIDVIGTYQSPFDLGSNITQTIYYKNDFPSMPVQGFITDIFLRIGWYSTSAGSTLPGLTVKMGIISYNEFPLGYGDPQFRATDSALTTVFYDSFYVLPATLPANSWWKLTLPQPYQYSMIPLPGDVPQNLIIQLSRSTYPTLQTNKFHIVYIDYASTRRRYTKARLNYDPTQPPGYIQGSGFPVDNAQLIGFNGYALSVDDPQKKIPFSVFPNPATDKLHVSKDVSGMYEVYDLRGVKVAAGKINEGEEVNVQNLVPGMYLLRMGERNTRFMKK